MWTVSAAAASGSSVRLGLTINGQQGALVLLLLIMAEINVPINDVVDPKVCLNSRLADVLSLVHTRSSLI